MQPLQQPPSQNSTPRFGDIEIPGREDMPVAKLENLPSTSAPVMDFIKPPINDAVDAGMQATVSVPLAQPKSKIPHIGLPVLSFNTSKIQIISMAMCLLFAGVAVISYSQMNKMKIANSKNSAYLAELQNQADLLRKEVVAIKSAEKINSAPAITAKKTVADLTEAEVKLMQTAVSARYPKCQSKYTQANFMIADVSQVYYLAGQKQTDYQKSQKITDDFVFANVGYVCGTQNYTAVLKKIIDGWVLLATDLSVYMPCSDVDGKAIPASIMPKCHELVSGKDTVRDIK